MTTNTAPASTSPARTSWRDIEWTHETGDADDFGYWTTERAQTVTTEFERRVCALLGVPLGPVTAEHKTIHGNPWGCDTWETDEEVEVTAGGRSRRFDGLAQLFAALDSAYLAA